MDQNLPKGKVAAGKVSDMAAMRQEPVREDTLCGLDMFTIITKILS